MYVLTVVLVANTNHRCLLGGVFLSNEKPIYLPGRVLPYKRLMGMCRWMGSHFHDWIDYNGVAFSIELLEWGRTFSVFGDERVLHISS